MSEMKFRKKPVVIEAMQWKVVDDAFSIKDWVNIESDYTNDDGGCTAEYDPFTAGETNEHSKGIDWGQFTIETIEGRMRVAPGDWVIKGVKGEFYPCKPDIFAETYERVEE